jgi:hypothetical protein
VLNSIEEGCQVDSVYNNFAKAFDQISTPAVYGVYSRTCVWTRWNVCREGSTD